MGTLPQLHVTTSENHPLSCSLGPSPYDRLGLTLSNFSASWLIVCRKCRKVSPFLLDVFVSLSSKCLPKSRWDLFLTLYLLDAPSKDILIDLTGSDRRTPTYARYVFVAAAEIWQRPRAGMYESLKADRCTGGK
ncbi:hypothetical protein AVEN_5464-1 [Araneus ventricosus]|uniref:Uncharacterized protein n=1 Tax=Araneus ventricosus TaxID=182803 RepID=A0A4Y2DWM8_ARAVE|nr:hypothetical protein AVEN_5464-1 [Araneus ventricosus]